MSLETEMGQSKQTSLATRLGMTFGILTAMALLVVGIVLILVSRQAQRQSVFVREHKTAHELALVISGYVNNVLDDLTLFVQIRHLARIDESSAKQALEELLAERSAQLSSLALIDAKGWERIKVSQYHAYLPSELKNRAQSYAYVKTMAGELYVGPMYLSPDSGLLMLEVAVPIDATTGTGGALIAEVDVTNLWQAVSSVEIGQSGYAYLVDEEGRIVAHQEPGKVLQQYGEDVSQLPPVTDFVADQPPGAHQAHEYEGLVDQQVVGLHAPIEGTDWAVIIELPTREVFASLTRMQWYLLGMVLVGSLVAGSVSFVVSRSRVRPILSLTEAAVAITGGDLDRTVSVESNDEVGALAQAFNSMTAQLREMLYNEQRQAAELQQGIAERERLQQELIEAQRRAIRELSTPIIPVMDRIIVVPLIGSIDTARARDITRILLAGISEHRAEVVILDITGVPIVDSGVAGYLNKTIQAARLKGARVVVTGISDAVAETIVDLGIDWSGIETLSDLQMGLVAALNRLGLTLTSLS